MRIVSRDFCATDRSYSEGIWQGRNMMMMSSSLFVSLFSFCQIFHVHLKCLLVYMFVCSTDGCWIIWDKKHITHSCSSSKCLIIIVEHQVSVSSMFVCSTDGCCSYEVEEGQAWSPDCWTCRKSFVPSKIIFHKRDKLDWWTCRKLFLFLEFSISPPVPRWEMFLHEGLCQEA